jgi:hypothetical protein
MPPSARRLGSVYITLAALVWSLAGFIVICAVVFQVTQGTE